MPINHPLADNSPDHEDQGLVLRARSGDHQALEDLHVLGKHLYGRLEIALIEGIGELLC